MREESVQDVVLINLRDGRATATSISSVGVGFPRSVCARLENDQAGSMNLSFAATGI